MLPSSVQRDRDDERARLRILEEVETLREELGAAEVGLGVEALVIRPRVKVAAGHANERTAHAEAGPNPPLIGRVDQRELAPLHEAAVFDELRLHSAGAAAIRRVPCLPVGERVERDFPGTRSRDVLSGKHILPEDAVRLANVGLGGGAKAIERRTRAIPHLTAA